MSVHQAISGQIEKRLLKEKEFLALDLRREEAIEETLTQAKKDPGEISVQRINQITKEMNQIAAHYRFPQRKNVTKEMIQSYINRKS
ncbi:DUF2533 family protein [Thalassorhabdus alkalitolerans]|uniref:DUF2533 family protein n=1 Tax=Thalassorhabdus alkalitolerans TaxID=2282697 RepID=A0ABW0YSC9_9BACI|nr:DUF2533 family protein [Thalassobacillus sp. C254]